MKSRTLQFAVLGLLMTAGALFVAYTLASLAAAVNGALSVGLR